MNKKYLENLNTWHCFFFDWFI